MEKVRVGIIGVGAIAQLAHIPNYSKRDDVELVAFVDHEVDRARKVAEAFAKETGRRVPNVYQTIDELLVNEQLDAISVCTPNTAHAEPALKALKKGIHVLLEKPMCTSLQEANELVAVAKESGKTFMIGMSHRFRNDVAVLKRYIDAGDVGEIYYAKTRILRRRGTPKGWFSDFAISGGGPLMDIGVHALDLTWWLVGAPQIDSVSGYLTKGIGNDRLDFLSPWQSQSPVNQSNKIYSTEDFAAAFLRFKNGLVMQLEVSWAINGPEDDALKVDIFGSTGGVSLDPLCFYGTRHNVLTSTTPSVGMGNFYENEINHFLDCVKTGTSPICDAKQGRDIVEILVAITESSSKKREIVF